MWGFYLLSDFNREESTRYGILNTQRHIAIRTSYVIDKGGIVRSIEQGHEAIDPSDAKLECSRQKKNG